MRGLGVTYILGWNMEDRVFLVADTALKTTGSHDVFDDWSSLTTFGDQSIENRDCRIHEGAAKLFNLSNAAIRSLC